MSPDKTSSCDSQTPPVNADAIVAAARGWLGTRWLHQGRNRAGIDCCGLVVKVHEELGCPVEDIKGYRRAPNSQIFLNHIRLQMDTACEPTPGAIGVFKEVTFACHVGIFGWSEDHDCLTLIHAHAAAGKVVEQYFTPDWHARLIEARRINGSII